MSAPFILLINPWIHDFAAYDLWARPLGLLSIAAVLRRNGFGVHVIDLLSCSHNTSAHRRLASKTAGRGHFHKEEIPKPQPLKRIPRRYSRYGITKNTLYSRLATLDHPAAVIMTSGMTYWYPGVFETIQSIRSVFQGVPILLGGIYATLCYKHARDHACADYVFSGAIDTRFSNIIELITGRKVPDHTVHSAWLDSELHIGYTSIPIVSSRGCPYSCSYCAAAILNPDFQQFSPSLIADYIEYWAARSDIKDYVFYDDALMVNPDRHIIPLLRQITRRNLGLRFHTPNGLHIRHINEAVAELMFSAGFKTIRLGLESCDDSINHQFAKKTSDKDFSRAVSILKKAGFTASELGAYVLAGLPGQHFQSADRTVRFVLEHEIRPLIAEYSPIPGTGLWPLAVQYSSFPIEAEPLFHNNTLLPCQSSYFTLDDLHRLKQTARQALQPEVRQGSGASLLYSEPDMRRET